VLAKRFSFVLSSYCLHTLVKIVEIVRPHHCSFAVSVFFPSFISAAIRGEKKMFNVGGAMLLDDVHDAPRHRGDTTGAGST